MMEVAMARIRDVVVGLLDAARAFVEIDEVLEPNNRARRCYVNRAGRWGGGYEC
jgi:hypothetical protein